MLLITCKNCNSLAGHAYDNQYKAANRLEKIRNTLISGKYDGGGSVLITVEGVELNALLTNENGRITFDINDKYNDWSIARDILPSLRANGISSFQVSHKSQFSPKNFAIALLKNAFLLGTAKLGYTFGLSDALKPVRDQLRNPSGDSFETLFLDMPSIPKDGIWIPRNEGWISVIFDGRAILLPWIYPIGANWKDTVKGLAIGNVTGFFLDLPNSFEAILDFGPSPGTANLLA